MSVPKELSLSEIRNFMLINNCKVTNHALVKHFKAFLTDPQTQNEARKQFKTYMNILATIKTENGVKYLILRKKYLNQCPSEDLAAAELNIAPMSPGGYSLHSEGEASPFRQPPPYKPPPQVSPSVIKMPILETETRENYRDCINEFQTAIKTIGGNNTSEICDKDIPPAVPPRKRMSFERSVSYDNSIDNKENITSTNLMVDNCNNDDVTASISDSENPISVKEATKKFNRMASEEEAKVLSPSSKKKPERMHSEEKPMVEEAVNISQHPKAKEWLVLAAKADYQKLAKLASEYSGLVKIQEPNTTALHWAAKHGNEDVVKLIAGTYKADVNARTNGGYTPLHLAMQFGRDNIFELLCNVYKANRDLTDWSGNKPLDYRKQRTSVSASTYSKIKARKKQSEKDLGFLRIGSLNVRVKKTTEAFSNFLGVGSGNTNSPLYQQNQMRTQMNQIPTNIRTSAPPSIHNYLDKIHKNWGSADNIQKHSKMPAPKTTSVKKRRSKRANDYDAAGYNSMPTTPNQLRAPIILSENNNSSEITIDSDSDSAFGFDNSWSTSRNNSEINVQKSSTYI